PQDVKTGMKRKWLFFAAGIFAVACIVICVMFSQRLKRNRVFVSFDGFTNDHRIAVFTVTNSLCSHIDYWTIIQSESGGVWYGLPPGTVLDFRDRREIQENQAAKLRVEAPTAPNRWRIEVCYSWHPNRDFFSGVRRFARQW